MTDARSRRAPSSCSAAETSTMRLDAEWRTAPTLDPCMPGFKLYSRDLCIREWNRNGNAARAGRRRNRRRPKCSPKGRGNEGDVSPNQFRRLRASAPASYGRRLAFACRGSEPIRSNDAWGNPHGRRLRWGPGGWLWSSFNRWCVERIHLDPRRCTRLPAPRYRNRIGQTADGGPSRARPNDMGAEGRSW